MRSLQLQGQYKSLSVMDWTGISPLAIVTGLNGVGKTQLLSVIAADSGVMELGGLLRFAASPVKLKPTPAPGSVGYLPALWELTDVKVTHEFFEPVNEVRGILESQLHVVGFDAREKWPGAARQK